MLFELQVGGEDVALKAGAGQGGQKQALAGRSAGVVQQNRGCMLGNAQEDRGMRQESL